MHVIKGWLWPSHTHDSCDMTMPNCRPSLRNPTAHKASHCISAKQFELTITLSTERGPSMKTVCKLLSEKPPSVLLRPLVLQIANHRLQLFEFADLIRKAFLQFHGQQTFNSDRAIWIRKGSPPALSTQSFQFATGFAENWDHKEFSSGAHLR